MKYRVSVLWIAIICSGFCGIAAADTFTVTNVDDSGTGSLRQAITDANGHLGLDTIAFNIPGSVVHTITPVTPLPTISDPVIIDGYTQPGAIQNSDPNGFNGALLIELDGSSAGKTNGLTIAAGGSVVKGLVINRFHGQTLGNGISLITAGGNRIEGNFLGTDASGTIDLGNEDNAISIQLGSASNTIGGSTPATRNVISGNDHVALFIETADNIIQGNFIGTKRDGTSPLGNLQGVGFVGVAGANNNLVGGTAAGTKNVIAFNDIRGVVGEITAGTGNSVLGNSIHSNGALGIDWVPVGPTANDLGDTDTGFNNLQNFPVLTSVSNSGGNTIIVGTLNSTLSTTFRLEFFANDTVDTSGYGEGQTFIGSTNVTTDSNGDATFNVSFPQITAGQHITATATDPNGNTSEFSAAIGQLLNISTRLRVQTGENVLIGGFILTGTDPKRVIVRAIGPSLAKFFPDFLADPTLELHGSGGFATVSNDNWKVRSDGGSQQAEIEATGLAPTNDLESALVQTLPANNAGYTAIVAGKNETNGIGLVEAYDLDTTVNSKLANISTRGFVETGNNVMIGGFIAGNGVTRVIVRAIGPSLTGSGIADALPDPTLELHDGTGATVGSDDNWREGGQEAEIIATGIPPTDNLESAIVAALPPGAYTAIVAGKDNTTGVGLVEVYNLPPQ